MSNVVRLSESELKELINESVINILMENEEDEGVWNQLKQGAKSFFGNGYRGKRGENYRNTTADRQDRGDYTANWLNATHPVNLKGRFKAAKTGWREQGRIDSNDDSVKVLDNLIKKYGENKTLGEIRRNLKRDTNGARGRISQANNGIYKGMSTGVMGSGRFRGV